MTSVLIVDDAAEYRELLSGLFQSSGFDVLTAEDGESARRARALAGP